MAYHPITQCPYICNVDLLWHPDHKSRPVTLDYTGTGGVIKAGTPISAAGAAANNGNAIGILLRDCYDGFHAAGNVVIDGFIRQDVAAEHSSVQLTDDAKRAMSKIVFVDASGVPDPAESGGSSGGGGGGFEYDFIIKADGETYTLDTGTYASINEKLGNQPLNGKIILNDGYGYLADLNCVLVLNNGESLRVCAFMGDNHVFLTINADNTVTG